MTDFTYDLSELFCVMMLLLPSLGHLLVFILLSGWDLCAMNVIPGIPMDTQVYSNNSTLNHSLKALFKPYLELHLSRICQEIQAFNYKQKDACISLVNHSVVNQFTTVTRRCKRLDSTCDPVQMINLTVQIR